MKKYLILFLFLMITLRGNGQNLLGTRWFAVKSEQLNGNHNLSDETPSYNAMFFFLIDTLECFPFIGNVNYSQPFSMIGDTLVAWNRRCKIDFRDDTVLVLSSIPFNDEIQDFAQRYYCIKDQFYLQYLLENNIVKANEHGIISANEYLYPIFRGNLRNFISKNLEPIHNGVEIEGSFVLESSGKMNGLHFSKCKNLVVPADSSILKKVILSTEGHWYFPETFDNKLEMPFKFKKLEWWEKKYFEVNYELSLLNIVFSTPEETKELPLDYAKAYNYFSEGNKLMEKEKYEKAIKLYNLSIEINPRFKDVYYNKDMALYHLSRNSEACEIWNKLASDGEVDAKAMLEQYCQ